MIRTRLYRSGSLILEDFPTADISEYVNDPDVAVWLDLCAPCSADFAMISKEFGLHELAVEDARHEYQRPKLDRYRTHAFLSAYGISTDETGGQLAASELAVFIMPTALITIRPDHRFDIEKVVERWHNNSDLAKYGGIPAVRTARPHSRRALRRCAGSRRPYRSSGGSALRRGARADVLRPA
ncbi:CorA family divalent cation transporter [Streptomyces sp. NPDC007205]|uniref:CorA family divalent cation transporter n=1 Tax=Streptomyces sp. NPDC007205 TaxID=3154316 RepID=UPI0033F32335